MKTLYTGRATTVAGRAGHTQTDDGKINLDLSPPGSNGPGSNPEQLFACGYSACFGGAVEAAAKKAGIKPQEVAVTASVSLNSSDDKGFFISVVLDTTVKGVDQKTAEQLVNTAHNEICPYSKATRNNVDVQLKVSGQALAA